MFDAAANGDAFDGDPAASTAMGEEVEAPADAPAVVRLAAFMGRRVG